MDFLTSIGVLLLCGLLLGSICKRLHLPSLVGTIGAIPLSMGLDCGQTILTAAVLCILITAPVGAFLIDSLHGRLLHKEM